MASKNKISLNLFAIPLLLASIIVNLGLLAGIAIEQHRLTQVYEYRVVNLVDLRHELLYLDEVLTMSAMMAVTTDDDQWRDRYHHYEPLLLKRFEASHRLTNSVAETQALQQAKTANNQMVALESQALVLAQDGQRQAALALLTSDGYKHHKKEYAQGVATLWSTAQEDTWQTMERGQRGIFIHAVLATIVFLLTIVLLLLLAVRMRKVVRLKEEQEGVLSRDRALLRSLLDTIPDIIFVKDHDFRLVEFNKAMIERTGRSDLYGKDGFDLFSKEEAQEYLESDQRMVAEGQAIQFEEVVVRPDGEKRYYDTIKTPYYGEKGESLGLVGVCREVTDRKRAEAANLAAKEAAEESSRAKSFYMAMLTHDIRTPMQLIMGFLDLLRSEDLSDDEKRIFLNRIEQACKALLGIVDDVLEYSHLESGQVVLEQDSIDLLTLLVSIKGLLEPRAMEKGLLLRVEIDSGIPKRVLGDTGRLRQVVLNLANNALKFTDHGEVRLKVTPAENGILFSVCDTGRGLSQEQLQRIFAPFVRSTGKDRYGGFGLGLAICRHLVERMGGRIWAESAEGKGSVFSFVCPMPAVNEFAKPRARPIAIPVATEGPFQCCCEGLRILLVDDASESHELLTAFLKNSSHSLDCVATGEEAVAMIHRQPYQVVLMDFHLGDGLDGLETVKLIRQGEANLGRKRMIIAAVTGSTGVVERTLAQEAGCDHFLEKPIFRAELLRFLDALCLHQNTDVLPEEHSNQ